MHRGGALSSRGRKRASYSNPIRVTSSLSRIHQISPRIMFSPPSRHSRTATAQEPILDAR